MTRLSGDVIDSEGVVRYGFDYNVQVWVKDYVVQKCGHTTFQGGCAKCVWRGEDIRNIPMHEHRVAA